MKKIAVLVVGLAIAFGSFGNVMPARAAGQATLTLSPTNISVASGDTFSLTVLVNPNGESLDTVRANSSFPATILQIDWFELGTQFPSLSPEYVIDNVNGDITFGGYKYGTRVTTSGTLATLTMRAISGGTATVRVESDSRLINNGVEKINTRALGSATISVSGGVTAPAPAPSADMTAEETSLIYFGALVGRMPSSGEDWDALHCMAYDTCAPAVQDLEREQAALEIFTAKYGRIPTTEIEWNTLHAIAYTNVVVDWEAEGYAPTTPAEEEAPPAAEEAVPTVGVVEGGQLAADAIGIFGQLTGRSPSTDEDWLAVDYIENGYTPATQDIDRELIGIGFFGQVYGRLPSAGADWNVVAAIAYTNAIVPAEEEVVEEVPVVEEAPVVEADKTLEQQALVYFGALVGRMPSSSVDWDALHCMAYDECYPGRENSDLDREGRALEVFGAKYARLPSTSLEWNVLHAIAYTDIVIDWSAEEAAPVEEEAPAPEAPAEGELYVTETTPENEALAIFGALAGRLPSSSEDWAAHQCIIDDSCYPGTADAEKEADALALYGSTFGSLPSDDMDWNAVHAIAYTNVFIDWSASAEASAESEAPAEAEAVTEEEGITEDEAIGLFGQITGRMPASSEDWLAVEYMQTGYTPSEEDRDLEKEGDAVDLFVSVFGRTPASSDDWNIIAAIAYSGAIL
jgi:hypothetical protein